MVQFFGRVVEVYKTEVELGSEFQESIDSGKDDSVPLTFLSLHFEALVVSSSAHN